MIHPPPCLKHRAKTASSAGGSGLSPPGGSGLSLVGGYGTDSPGDADDRGKKDEEEGEGPLEEGGDLDIADQGVQMQHRAYYYSSWAQL